MAGIQPIFLLVFIVAPVVFLILLGIFKPARLPWAAALSLVLDLLIYGSDLLYVEYRTPMLMLFLVQSAAVLVLALAVQFILSQSHSSK